MRQEEQQQLQGKYTQINRASKAIILNNKTKIFIPGFSGRKKKWTRLKTLFEKIDDRKSPKFVEKNV